MAKKRLSSVRSSRSANVEKIPFQSDKPHNFWRSLTEAEQHPIEKHSIKHTQVNWAQCDSTGKQCKTDRLTLPLIKGSRQTPMQIKDNILHIIQAPTKWDCHCTIVDVCEKCQEDRKTILDYLNKRTEDELRKLSQSKERTPVKRFEFEYPDPPGSDIDFAALSTFVSMSHLDTKEEQMLEEAAKNRRMKKNKSLRATIKKTKKGPEIKSRLNMEIEALLSLEAKKTVKRADSVTHRTDSKVNFADSTYNHSSTGLEPFTYRKSSQSPSLHRRKNYSLTDGRIRHGTLPMSGNTPLELDETPPATPTTASPSHKPHSYGFTEWEIVKSNLTRFRKAPPSTLEHRDVHSSLVRAIQLRKEFSTDHHAKEIRTMIDELTKLVYDCVIHKLKDALLPENIERISLKHLITLKADVTRNLTKYDLFDTENIQFHAKKFIRSKVVVKMREYKVNKSKKDARKLLDTLKDSAEYNWSDLITEVKKLNADLAKPEAVVNKERNQGAARKSTY